jgi:hypothetical protein
MATFALGHWTAKTNQANLELKASLEHTSLNTTPAKVTWILTASDTITLRGIPAIGRGVEGAIKHTRPDKEL